MKTLARGVGILLMWLFVAPVHAATGAEAEFVRAFRHYSDGDHSRAETLFRRALADTTLVLGDYALYYLGRIASETGQHDEARGYLERLKKSFPKSIWALEASFLRVELDLTQKRYQAAIRGAAALKKTASGKGGTSPSRLLSRPGPRSRRRGPQGARLPSGGAPARPPLHLGQPRPGKSPGASPGESEAIRFP